MAEATKKADTAEGVGGSDLSDTGVKAPKAAEAVEKNVAPKEASKKAAPKKERPVFRLGPDGPLVNSWGKPVGE